MGTKTYRKIQRSNTEGRVEFSWAIGSYRERGDRCAQLCSEGFSCLSDILPSNPCFFLSPHSVCVPEAQQDGQHLSPSYVRSLLSLSLLPPSHLCSSLLSGTELSHIFFLIPFFFFFSSDFCQSCHLLHSRNMEYWRYCLGKYVTKI